MSSHIPVDGLSGTTDRAMTIRRDQITPGRIYMETPRYLALTPDQAIAIANRLADLLEGDTQ